MSQPNQNTTEHDLTSKTSPPRDTAVRAPSPRGESPPARTAEQQPLLRLVEGSSASPPQRALHFEPALRRADPGDRRLATLLSLRGGSASQPELGSVAPPKRLLPPKAKSRSDPNLVRKWHVDHASLTPRPDDGFPPLRTARVVPAARAELVANRLADCLRARSIATRFGRENRANHHVARCRSVGYGKFTVRLYAAASEGGVLVEVQRLCGDCVSFMRDCRALLKAAEGKAADDAHGAADEASLYLRLPVSSAEFVKKATSNVPPASPAEEDAAVAVTAELLASQRSDTNRLGMEALVLQTDPRTTLRSTAVRTARLVLVPDDPGNASLSVHNYVMSLLLFGSPEEDPAPARPEEDDAALADHYAHLRVLGLAALSNALALLAAEGVLAAVLAPHDRWHAAVLVPRLLRDLGTASARPLEACYASRCLAALVGSGPAALARAVEAAGGRDALARAEGVGAREFALLARDAGRCRRALRCGA